MNRNWSMILIGAIASIAMVPRAQAQVRLFGMDTMTIVELDPATGSAIHSMPLVGAPWGYMGGLAYDASTDTLFMSSTSFHQLWTLDYTTGVATLIGPYNVAGISMHGLEIDDTGQLYGYSWSTGGTPRFFSIDRTTGQATPISDPGTGGFGSLGFVPSTGTMYLADTTLEQLLTIDRTTGVTTVVGPLGTFPGSAGSVGVALAYHPQYGMYAAANIATDSLWTIDLASGSATLLAGGLLTDNLIALAFVGEGPPGTTFCPGDGTGAACPCANQSAVGSGTGCLSSLGVGGRLVDAGIASLSNDTVVLLGTNMPNSSALFFQGTAQQAGGAGTAFGDGLRCAAGSIVRLGTTMNASGASQYPFGALPSVSVKGNITAPGTRTYQVWYRNAAAFCTPSTHNLTNGREMTWSP